MEQLRGKSDPMEVGESACGGGGGYGTTQSGGASICPLPQGQG